MEEGSVPGLRKCVHGGMFVSEEEDLACVSTRRYWRVFVRPLRRSVCRHAYVCVCACVHACVCTWGTKPRDCGSESVFPGSRCTLASSPTLRVPLQLRGSQGVGKQYMSDLQTERCQP